MSNPPIEEPSGKEFPVVRIWIDEPDNNRIFPNEKKLYVSGYARATVKEYTGSGEHPVDFNGDLNLEITANDKHYKEILHGPLDTTKESPGERNRYWNCEFSIEPTSFSPNIIDQFFNIHISVISCGFDHF